jgi:hypothetical protein
LGDTESASPQQTNKSHHCNVVGRNDDRRSCRTKWYNSESSLETPHPNIRPVFDILNAGFRHQFVVAGRSGPLIVHNCENAVQAIAADILRETATRIETNPVLSFMPIRMTCHDEIVCECDEDRTEEAKAILRREMLIAGMGRRAPASERRARMQLVHQIKNRTERQVIG